MPDHKYIKRERKNGKWRYWYEEPGGPAKLPKKEPAKSTEPVLSTKQLDTKNPVRAYKTEDGRTVYAPAKTTKSIANKTISEVKKELDSTKSEPYVSDEYKQELEYNSKKNSFTNDSTPAEAKQWLEDQWAKQAAQAEKKYRDGLSEVDKFLGEEKKYDMSKAKVAVNDAEWEYERYKSLYESSNKKWEEASEAAWQELNRVKWDRSKADSKILENEDVWSDIKNGEFDKMLEAEKALREAEKALKKAEKEYAKTPMGIADKVSDLADKAADTIENGADAVKDMFKRLKRKLG